MRRILVLGRGGAGKSTLAARLTGGPRWVIDGDLGLDFPLWRCAVRALRRSRGNLAFWRWLIGYRRGSLPTVMAAIAAIAGDANFTCSARRAPSNDSSAGREHDQQSTDLDKQPIVSAKPVSIAKAARPQPSTVFQHNPSAEEADLRRCGGAARARSRTAIAKFRRLLPTRRTRSKLSQSIPKLGGPGCPVRDRVLR